MIKMIWINGTFGVGKTATAYELHRRIKDSFVFDPEEAGFYISNNMPKHLGKSDFQDHKMWRTFNHDMLKYILSSYKGVVIVPMTIVNETYMDEILKTLPIAEESIYHYTLMASEKTIRKRLKIRGEIKSGWAIDHIKPNLEALMKPYFKKQVFTDTLNINQVVEHIAADASITLDHNRLSYIKFKIARLKVQLKHIRV